MSVSAEVHGTNPEMSLVVVPEPPISSDPPSIVVDEASSEVPAPDGAPPSKFDENSASETKSGNCSFSSGEECNGDGDGSNVGSGGGDRGSRAGSKKGSRTKRAFPKFSVFLTTVGGDYCPWISKPRRPSGSRRHPAGSYEPDKTTEMCPETTLVEFISTSAGYHGVTRMSIRQLEWDILKVFSNNIMPANAAAWYMAKRKFYLNQPFESQLLCFLLKKYSDKFLVHRDRVDFLEVYSKEVAKKKLSFMVQQGLYSYFSHKADEYGVYFFDSNYYLGTEPFHMSLKTSSKSRSPADGNKLIQNYFAQYNKQFRLINHASNLVSLAKAEIPVVTNVTGVIVNMINNLYGIIKFGSGDKALFSAKTLFKDGWNYKGDPLRLPAMRFDGYQLPVHQSEALDFNFHAVLVWCGRKPSPKFCATLVDLDGCPKGSEYNFKLCTSPSRVQGSSSSGTSSSSACSPELKEEASPSSNAPAGIKKEDGMIVGEVFEIRKDLALVTMKNKESNDPVAIPGWRMSNRVNEGSFLTTTTGVTLGVGDMVAYYLDPNVKVPSYELVGHQVIVLKQAEVTKKKLVEPTDAEFESPNTRNCVQRQYARAANKFISQKDLAGSWNTMKRLDDANNDVYNEDSDRTYVPSSLPFPSSSMSAALNGNNDDSSNYDSLDEADDVSDGELTFLKDGINDLISKERHGGPSSDWRSVAFLQKVLQETNNVINTRNLRRGVGLSAAGNDGGNHHRPPRSGTPISQDSGMSSSRETTPKDKNKKEGFWRMKKAFECLDEYDSDDDPSFDPSDNPKASAKASKKADNKNSPKKLNESTSTTNNASVASEVVVAAAAAASPPALPHHWLNDIINDDVVYCIHRSKFVSNESVKDSDNDLHEYSPPDIYHEDYYYYENDANDDESGENKKENYSYEIPEEELAGLKSDLEVDPVKITDEMLEGVFPEGKIPPRIRRRASYAPSWAFMLLRGSKIVLEEDENGVPFIPKMDEKELEEGVSDKEEGKKYPDFFPSPIIWDEDLDYDEYSDVEIDEEEVKCLMEEKDAPLPIIDCKCGFAVTDAENKSDKKENSTDKNSVENDSPIVLVKDDGQNSEEKGSNDESEIIEEKKEASLEEKILEVLEPEISKDEESEKTKASAETVAAKDN